MYFLISENRFLMGPLVLSGFQIRPAKRRKTLHEAKYTARGRDITARMQNEPHEGGRHCTTLRESKIHCSRAEDHYTQAEYTARRRKTLHVGRMHSTNGRHCTRAEITARMRKTLHECRIHRTSAEDTARGQKTPQEGGRHYPEADR